VTNSSGLVKQLQKYGGAYGKRHTDVGDDLLKAADRIEMLEAALRRLMQVCEEGDHQGRAIDLIPHGEWQHAMRVLEGKWS